MDFIILKEQIVDTDIIVSPLRYVLYDHFLTISGLTDYKALKLKKLANDEHIFHTGPDGHLFVDLPIFQKYVANLTIKSKQVYMNSGLNIITSGLYSKLSGYSAKAIERKVEDKVWDFKLAFRGPDGTGLLINIQRVETWIKNAKN